MALGESSENLDRRADKVQEMSGCWESREEESVESCVAELESYPC